MTLDELITELIDIKMCNPSSLNYEVTICINDDVWCAEYVDVDMDTKTIVIEN